MSRPLFAVVLCGMLGCGGRGDRPPYATVAYNTGTGGNSSGFNVTTGGGDCGPPVSDAGLCGNEVLPTQQDRPNLYFIIDVSYSMHETFDSTGTGPTKYAAAVSAIIEVLELIGHRVSYGAAVFPFSSLNNCEPGAELFKTQPGDSVVCAINGKVGDILTNLEKALDGISPGGNTPLSATLTVLEPTLTALPGTTAVILATDGAPNCNPDVSCGPALCEYNIDGDTIDGILCQAPVNCCDQNGGGCVDNVATDAALTQLHNAGISTYVIGLPGIEATLGSVLDGMADAGGTARSGSPSYYEVSDSQTLATTLRSIATQIAVSCTITLQNTPPNWGQVNVYLDALEVPSSTDNGWTQIDDHTLEITGSYCTTLQTGNVFQVQVTAGCPTFLQ